MLLQNTDIKVDTRNDHNFNFCKIPENESSAANEKVLTHIFFCQILSKALNIGRREEIRGEFIP